jgi:hypothetical protein
MIKCYNILYINSFNFTLSPINYSICQGENQYTSKRRRDKVKDKIVHLNLETK